MISSSFIPALPEEDFRLPPPFFGSRLSRRGSIQRREELLFDYVRHLEQFLPPADTGLLTVSNNSLIFYFSYCLNNSVQVSVNENHFQTNHFQCYSLLLRHLFFYFQIRSYAVMLKNFYSLQNLLALNSDQGIAEHGLEGCSTDIDNLEKLLRESLRDVQIRTDRSMHPSERFRYIR